MVQPVVGVGDLDFMCAIYYTLQRENMLASLYLTPLMGLEAALIMGLQAGGAPALPFMTLVLYLA